MKAAETIPKTSVMPPVAKTVSSSMPLPSCASAILASKIPTPRPAARAKARMARFPTQQHVRVGLSTRPFTVRQTSTATPRTKCAPRIRFRIASTLVASRATPPAALVDLLTARVPVLLVCCAARRMINVESIPFVWSATDLLRTKLRALAVRMIALEEQEERNYFVIHQGVCVVQPTCSRQAQLQQHLCVTTLMVRLSIPQVVHASVGPAASAA